MIIDMEKTAAIIAGIAEEEIASRFGVLGKSDISTKTGPGDFVTAADHAAERRLKSALHDLYPAAGFIGEETAAGDPAILSKLEGDGAFWIVDPLDGTRNFVEGVSEFGSIVALVEDGEIRQGWIYAIPKHAFAMAAAGEGAAWRGDKLQPVNEPEAPVTGYRAVGALYPEWRDRIVKPLRREFETAPARCSAYAYIDLIRGKRDFSLSSRCSPWDHAAGVLMLREIGGRAEYIDNGEPYAPQTTTGRPMLAAGNENVWKAVKQTLGSGA
ncbi:inositol monophosphatase family protein [Hyphococcus sp.]|uniref:inositol monophosphatase family protein n=1 Tax=Hyphococcus sp. TaxID=2038636 RepID=UPI003CCBDE34